MKTLKLNYPVHTLDGKELFAAGSVLTHEAIQEARLEISASTARIPFPFKTRLSVQ